MLSQVFSVCGRLLLLTTIITWVLPTITLISLFKYVCKIYHCTIFDLITEVSLIHPVGKGEEQGEHESEQDGNQQEETEEDRRHRVLLERIFAILSPDDLEVQDVAKEIKGTVNHQSHLE